MKISDAGLGSGELKCVSTNKTLGPNHCVIMPIWERFCYFYVIYVLLKNFVINYHTNSS